MPQQPPTRINPQSLDDYLEVMSKAVLQTGISWKVVEAKWPGIRDALAGFDTHRVAGLTPEDIDRLMTDPRLIRNRRKIEGIVHNAGRLMALERQHGSFAAYLRTQPDFASRLAELRKQFQFIGSMGWYYVLYVVGETVPPYEEFMASQPAPRRPASARAKRT